GGNNGIATVSKALNLVGVDNAKNGSSMSDDSPFKKQVMELEKEVINLRDRINEIERILEADEKIIEKILELDDKLKNNQA
ncbi:MAG: AAA family ATPase, partial [Vulcanisaeta sp.]